MDHGGSLNVLSAVGDTLTSLDFSLPKFLRRYRTGQLAEPEATSSTSIYTIRLHECSLWMVRTWSSSASRAPSLDLAVRRPHKLGYFARLLAELHHRLHEIPAPENLGQTLRRGDRVLHLDLQPANVVMTRRGPVVLDLGWSAVPRWTTPTPRSGRQRRLLDRRRYEPATAISRRIFIRHFLKEFEMDSLRGVMAEVAEGVWSDVRGFHSNEAHGDPVSGTCCDLNDPFPGQLLRRFPDLDGCVRDHRCYE